MKKELLEVLTAEACQLHRQRKVVREEQEGIAMTCKAGGMNIRSLTQCSMTPHAPLEKWIMCEEEFYLENREVDF